MPKEDWKQLPNGFWKHSSGTFIKPTSIKMGEQFLWDIIWKDGTIEGVLHLGSKQAVRVVESGIKNQARPRRENVKDQSTTDDGIF